VERGKLGMDLRDYIVGNANAVDANASVGICRKVATDVRLRRNGQTHVNIGADIGGGNGVVPKSEIDIFTAAQR
jgi:hypothetical protein